MSWVCTGISLQLFSVKCYWPLEKNCKVEVKFVLNYLDKIGLELQQIWPELDEISTENVILTTKCIKNVLNMHLILLPTPAGSLDRLASISLPETKQIKLEIYFVKFLWSHLLNMITYLHKTGQTDLWSA